MEGSRLLSTLFFVGYVGVSVWFTSVSAIAAEATEADEAAEKLQRKKAAFKAGVQLKIGVNQKMEATLYKPPGAGPFPAVLVLHTSEGLSPGEHQFARMLAIKGGYVTLVPDFFKAYDLHQNIRDRTFTTHAQSIYADFASAIDMLKKMEGVQTDRVGAVGFSNGGYWALLLAAKGQVQAGVSHYGALNGAGTDNSLSAFQAAFTANSSPVLIMHGTDDRTVPSHYAEYLVSVLKKANAPHEFQLFRSAGHGWNATHYVEAANESREQTLRFLNATLRKKEQMGKP